MAYKFFIAEHISTPIISFENSIFYAEKVINGLTSVNASDYTDTFSVKPRVQDMVGPNLLDIEERSHFVGVISCQFSANA